MKIIGLYVRPFETRLCRQQWLSFLYIKSCVIGCPVEGIVPPSKVANVAKELHGQDLGTEYRDQMQFNDAELHSDTSLGIGVDQSPSIHGLSRQQGSPDCYMFNNMFSHEVPYIIS
ncbi:hypothetical protein Tco_0802319 [Tanacetum coccineum]|uniref:Uncharacterized protein n=1 Tax=Tanacetum coccineum TaxID=301880 RepID=A0ABQ5A0U2_9ASTR